MHSEGFYLPRQLRTRQNRKHAVPSPSRRGESWETGTQTEWKCTGVIKNDILSQCVAWTQKRFNTRASRYERVEYRHKPRKYVSVRRSSPLVTLLRPPLLQPDAFHVSWCGCWGQTWGDREESESGGGGSGHWTWLPSGRLLSFLQAAFCELINDTA